MIDLNRKQQIILDHLDGMANRQIAAKMHMSKDTVNKYVKEYDEKKLHCWPVILMQIRKKSSKHS